jgi:transcriptional regulator with XRE-family HTH domain
MQDAISDHISTEDKKPVHTLIGARIRQLREDKELSQGAIEQRTGLMRCYVSRVENGHKVPSLETLERFASALEVPLYRLFYEGDEPPIPLVSVRLPLEELVDGKDETTTHARFLRKLGRVYRRMADSDRRVLLAMAKKLLGRGEEVVEGKDVVDFSRRREHSPAPGL